MKRGPYFWLYIAACYASIAVAAGLSLVFGYVIHPAFGAFSGVCFGFLIPPKIVDPLADWSSRKDIQRRYK